MQFVKNFNFYGVEAKQIPCLVGSGAPTTKTEGAVGCLYMDTDNGGMYKCTRVGDWQGEAYYEWQNIISEDNNKLKMFAYDDGKLRGSVMMYATDDVHNDALGYKCGVMEFSGGVDNDVEVIVRRVAPGILDSDAATVGQLKAAKTEILEQILAELPDGDEVSY